MHCRESKRKISMLLDGELAGPDEQRLREHLAVCAECRREKEELFTLFSGIAGPATVAPSPRFFAAVRRKIEERSRTSVFFPAGLNAWARGLALAAPLALMLLAGTYFGTAFWADLLRPAAESTANLYTSGDLSEEFNDIYFNGIEEG